MITITCNNSPNETWYICGDGRSFEIPITSVWIEIDEMHRLFIRAGTFTSPQLNDPTSTPQLDIRDATLIINGEIPQIVPLNTQYVVSLLGLDDVKTFILHGLDCIIASRLLSELDKS